MEEDFGTQGPTLDQQFYDKLAVALAEHLKHCGSRVPVITGMPVDCWEILPHLHSPKASLVRCLDHYFVK